MHLVPILFVGSLTPAQHVFAEHRSLFRTPLSHSSATRRVRQSQNRAYQTPYRRPISWSHKFFCFANTSASTVPMSKSSKEALAAVGLGEKVLSLRCNGSAEELHNLLLETFPPLVLCGGYTLWKGMAKSKKLEILEPPPGGHTPISISGVVGQSRVYVKPLQRDIPLVQLNRITEVSQ